MSGAGAAKNPSYVVCGVLAFLPWLAACGSQAASGASESDPGPGGANTEDNCAEASPGEPVTLEARLEVIATGQAFAGAWGPLNMPSIVADASGVYWYDSSGAVHARQGSGDVETLRPGRGSQDSGPSQFVVGITADADRLYVADAVHEPFDYPMEFNPPGRLLAYPKAGGPAELLLELEDSTIYPLTTDGERMIALVVAHGDAAYYQLDVENPQLDHRLMPWSGGYPKLSGGALYWSDFESPPTLRRFGFDDAAPEVVRSLPSNDFEIGPGYLLSIEEHWDSAKRRVAQNFVLHGAATDPDRPLPGTGELISHERAHDAQHIYWYGYPGDNGTGYYDPRHQLVRVNIDCNTLEQLATPGIIPGNPGPQIVGQYADTLYIKNGDTLFAVQKP